MLEIFDQGRKRVAVLENAHQIRESARLNAIGTLSFRLPEDDPKNGYCRPFFFARMNGGELYRIMGEETERREAGSVTYACEHVLSTLLDTAVTDFFSIGNLGVYTRDVIAHLLGLQKQKDWVLGICDFARQFEYGFEKETILSALLAVAAPLAEPYAWETDTTGYPWRLSLRRIDTATKPKLYIREGMNQLKLLRKSDPKRICTRLYAYGYGEGVNQLKAGPFTSPQSYLDRYGLIERCWVDRRYESMETLSAAAKAMLAELQEQYVEWSVEVADRGDTGDLRPGDMVRIVSADLNTYITGIDRVHDETPGLTLTIANRPGDIASTVADMADRQRIEAAYSQGATQLYAQSVQANATTAKGAVLRFYIPQEMRIVNAVKAKIALSPFRSYSRSTRGGGGSSQTSNAGGGGTTSAGGGTYGSTGTDSEKSRSSGASSKSTSDSTAPDIVAYTGRQDTGASGSDMYTRLANGHQHGIPPHIHTTTISGARHSHGMDHTHTFTIPAHNHTVEIGAHSHSVPAHSHQVNVPDHAHDIEQGIFEFGSAASAGVYVNGVRKASVGTDTELDLTAHLAGTGGSIPRGQWLSVEVRPDDLAYVTIDLFVQGFVQSRGGANH